MQNLLEMLSLSFANLSEHEYAESDKQSDNMTLSWNNKSPITPKRRLVIFLRYVFEKNNSAWIFRFENYSIVRRTSQ